MNDPCLVCDTHKNGDDKITTHCIACKDKNAYYRSLDQPIKAMDVKMKFCLKCRTEKPIGKFGRGGLAKVCTDCIPASAKPLHKKEKPKMETKPSDAIKSNGKDLVANKEQAKKAMAVLDGLMAMTPKEEEDPDQFKPGVVVHELRPPTVTEYMLGIPNAQSGGYGDTVVVNRPPMVGMRKIPIPIGTDHVWYAIVPEKLSQQDLWRFTQVCLLALSEKQFRVEEQE